MASTGYKIGEWAKEEDILGKIEGSGNLFTATAKTSKRSN